jgi:hypothetical protein
VLPARDNSTQPGAASSRMNTVTSVNEFLQALVAKRLCEELASGDLLWLVVGYLGGFENKLRNSQPYWGVPLMEDASGGAESLKLHDSEIRHGPGRSKRWRLPVRERYVARLQAIRVLRFRGVSVCHGTPAAGRTGNPERRRQDASTLHVLKSVAANRNPFPERTKPTITVIHSRSQEAQVYADFCQPLRAFDSTLSFQPIPANMLSLRELTRAIRTANADIIALIRGGGSDEQFSMFENPDMLRAWSETRCAHIGTHNNTSRNCEHRTTSCVCSCVRCRCTTLHNH